MHSQQLIAATRPLYDRAIAAAALGAWECNLADETLSWTDGVYDLFGLRRGSEIHRKATLDLYEDASRREMERHRSNAIRSGQGFALDCRIRTANGELRWMRLIVGVGYRQGRPVRIFGSKQDVTAEKGLWTRLSPLVRAESPAGPGARSDFAEALRQLRREPGRERERFALAIVAVDRFPALLEIHGRAAGEDVIRGLGERLRRLFPDALAIDRTGPAAIGLLLRMTGDGSNLASMLSGARRLLGRPIARGGHAVVEVTLSIGAALLEPGHRPRHDGILADAEAALHVAGLAGGDCVRVFDGPLTTVAG